MSIQFTYQKVSPRLEKILQSIDRPGEFCAYGRVSVPMPRVEIDDFGILSFPVPGSHIEQLIRLAEQAPYGRGQETLVDTTVRNCWQINADQLSLGGSSWCKTLQEFLRLAADGLGVPYKRLKAELYKLLIYQTGGFFVPHRDTEKSDGMIATLTISLPVEGTGGELVVRHKEREMKLEMNVDDPSELAYAVFYADCQHEIKEVRSGHRVSLVFNLLIEPDDNQTLLTAPDYTREVDAIAEELQLWCEKQDAVNKLIWILDHSYSKAGLSFDTLKNGDRAVAGALVTASEKVDCELYASIVYISETFDAWYAGKRYRYYYDDGGDSMDNWEIGELFERWVRMDNWASPEGRNPKFGKLPINDHELMPGRVLDNVSPDEEQIDEATGNEGATLERVYHHAALVLFKRAGILDELVKHSIQSGVFWVAEELDRNGGVANEYIIESMQRLTNAWPVLPNHYYRAVGFSEMFQLLLKVGNQRVSREFLCEVASRNYIGKENDEFATVLSTFNAADTKEVLLVLINNKFSQYPNGVLKILTLLDRKMDHSVSSKQRVFKECAHQIFRMLPDVLSRWTNQSQYRHESKHATIRKKAIERLFLLFWRGDSMDVAAFVPEEFDKFPEAVSLDREVPKALVKLREINEVFHSEVYISLWRVSANYLLDRSGTPPEEPKDWKIAAALNCDCPLCKNLQEFCENAEQRVARFPLRKDLRKHLHQQIDKNRLDLNHETERKGSPYTLVCTKNRATYMRRLKEYSKDIKQMNSLAIMMDGTERRHEAEDEVVRLRVAVERGNAEE